MSEPERLHPAAILEYLLKNIRSLIETLLPLIIILFTSDLRRKWIIGLFAAGLVIYIAFAVLHWLRYRYYVYNNELRVEHGVLTSKKSYIPLERIQSVQTTAGIVHRIFGLVKLEVQTAGGGSKAEVILPAISLEKAEQLEKVLKLRSVHNSGEDSLTDPSPLQEKSLSRKGLIIAATTSNGLGVVLAGAGAFISQLDDLIPEDISARMGEAVNAYAHQGIIIWILGALFILIIAWLISMLGTVLSMGGFVITREEDRLVVKRGLLEKRQVSIPLKRIQAVKIVEGVLRQPFGLVTLHVVSAGHRDESGADALIFPLLPKKQVKDFLQTFVPEFNIEQEMMPLAEAAKNRYRLIYTVPALLAAIALCIFVPYGFIGFILPIAGFLLGVQQFKDAGWSVKGEQMIVRHRIIGRITYLVPRRRVQSVELLQNPLQRRKGLSAFNVQLASSLGGTSVGLKGISEEQGYEILNWVRREKLEARRG